MGYNFWQDFFDTYQSLSDWIKALWLIVPPTFLLVLIRQFVRGKKQQAAEPIANGRLIYSIYRDDLKRTHILSHLPEFAEVPDVILLDPLRNDAVENETTALLSDIGTRPAGH